MVQDNKEFDKDIRDLLYDVEEEVPSGIADKVFSRLDGANEKSRKLPVWLGWGLSGMAMAAAVALVVILWPARNENGVNVQSDAIAVVESPDSASSESDNILASMELPDEPEGSEPAASSPSRDNCVPSEIKSESNLVDESSAAQKTAGSESKSENMSESEAVVRISEKETPECTVVEGDAVDENRFVGADDEEETLSPKVSLLFGGDVSSNGEAKGIGRFGGFRIPSLDAKDITYIEQTSKNSSYSIPLTFGLNAKVNFTDKWAVGAGLNWTMLRRTFDGRYVKIENGIHKSIDSEIRHTLQYVGIPVNAYFNIIQSPRIKFYTYAGGTVEKAVSNVYKVLDAKDIPSIRSGVKGVQLSAGAGLGVEFILVDWLGLYVNPGVRYYFDCNQPVSIRTQQPFMMDFDIGLRIEL